MNKTAFDFDAERIARMDNGDLMREYLQTNKDSLCRMFGHNARVYGNQLVDEMQRRGIGEIPNIFGPIRVTRFEMR